MTLLATTVERLVAAARDARVGAHAPYSQYRVGAAILTRSGAIHKGCNVENASYGATLCAERGAVGAMIAARDRDPIACAVVTGGPRPGAPCGICRQVLVEFARDMAIVLVAENDAGVITSQRRIRLRALLPRPFRLRID